MEKPVEMPGRYYLKSLHEEIDLFDRKLAHMAKHGVFATDAERQTALGKMSTKRAKLARAAQKLVEDGVEYLPSELPRSLRETVVSAEAVSAS